MLMSVKWHGNLERKKENLLPGLKWIELCFSCTEIEATNKEKSEPKASKVVTIEVQPRSSTIKASIMTIIQWHTQVKNLSFLSLKKNNRNSVEHFYKEMLNKQTDKKDVSWAEKIPGKFLTLGNSFQIFYLFVVHLKQRIQGWRWKLKKFRMFVDFPIDKQAYFGKIHPSRY